MTEQQLNIKSYRSRILIVGFRTLVISLLVIFYLLVTHAASAQKLFSAAYLNQFSSESLLPTEIKSSDVLGSDIQSSLQSKETKAGGKKWFEGIRYSGNARVIGFYRNMKEYYTADPNLLAGLNMPTTLMVGDGTQWPMLYILAEANPSPTSKFKVEFNFDHLMLRTSYYGRQNMDDEGRIASLFTLFNFDADVDLSFGHMKLITGGGVNWQRLSPTTFWGYDVRLDFFERQPWEGEIRDFERYDYFYHKEDVPRDQGFGMQPAQGIVLELTNLPLGFETKLLYGKNNNTGGYQSYLRRDPQMMVAGRLAKSFGDHKIGYNLLKNTGHFADTINYSEIIQGTDTFYLEENYVSTTMTSVDARLKFDKFKAFVEVGAGSYMSTLYNDGLQDNAKPGIEGASRYKRNWSESLILEITADKDFLKVPFKASYFRMGENVVNNNSSILNASRQAVASNPTVGAAFNTGYFDGYLGDVGQFVNNRQGFNLWTFLNHKKLHTVLGLSFAQELKNLAGDIRNSNRGGIMGVTDSASLVPFTNTVTFEHRLNSVARSRFGYYQSFTGPYNRISTLFRRTVESVAITDTEIDYKKSFSTLELQLKYKLKLFRKELILMNFVNAMTSQENFSPIPVLSDKAFVRYFYEEFMAFWAVKQKVTLIGFFGVEKVVGNNRTELADANGNLITDANGRPIADANGKPINQTGFGFGLGADLDLGDRASLHLRNRWYTHSDKNFINDEFRGYEMMVELKKFF